MWFPGWSQISFQGDAKNVLSATIPTSSGVLWAARLTAMPSEHGSRVSSHTSCEPSRCDVSEKVCTVGEDPEDGRSGVAFSCEVRSSGVLGILG